MDARVSCDVLDDPRWPALSLEARVFYLHLRGWLAGEADGRIERSCLSDGIAAEALGPVCHLTTTAILEELAAPDGRLVVLEDDHIEVLGVFSVETPKPKTPPEPKKEKRFEGPAELRKKRRAAKAATEQSKDEWADSVFQNWNDFAAWANAHGGFSKKVAAVKPTTQSVRRHVLARYKDPAWQGDYWPPMLQRLMTLLPHWRGEGGWVINLDYLARNDGQAERLLNGEWSSETGDDRRGPVKISTAEATEILKKLESEAPW